MNTHAHDSHAEDCRVSEGESIRSEDVDNNFPLDEEIVPDVGDTSLATEYTAHFVEIQAELAALRELIQRSIGDRSTFKQMSETIQQLRQDQISTLLLPGIRRVTNALHAISDALGKDDSEYALEDYHRIFHQELEYLDSVLRDSLENFGFAEVSSFPGSPFHPRRHQAKGKIPTGDETLDKTIAEVLHSGFTFADAERAIIPAQVTVYQYKPDLAETPTEPKSSADSPDSPESIEAI